MNGLPAASGRQPRWRTVAYWTATGLIAAEFAVGGVTDLFHLPPFAPALTELGYPAYLGVILGTWKLLGTAAVLVPGMPRLKEWAYAGMTFDLTGAIASYLFTGGGFGNLVTPAVFLALVAVSWSLRPPSRRLV